MSRPLTISGLRVDAPISGSNTIAGLRFANRSISLRSRRRPRSGFCWNGSESHFGPPTAPKRTASLCCASRSVSSVSGTPWASSAAPPTRPSVTSKVAMRRRPNHSMTRLTWRITSGPMPSPGSDSTFLLAAIVDVLRGKCGRSGVEPGLAQALPLLVAVDRRRLLHGEADVVEAVQEHVLPESINLEVDLLAVGPLDSLRREVDGEPGVGSLAGVVHELVDDLLRQLDRENAVLEA